MCVLNEYIPSDVPSMNVFLNAALHPKVKVHSAVLQIHVNITTTQQLCLQMCELFSFGGHHPSMSTDTDSCENNSVDADTNSGCLQI